MSRTATIFRGVETEVVTRAFPIWYPRGFESEGALSSWYYVLAFGFPRRVLYVRGSVACIR